MEKRRAKVTYHGLVWCVEGYYLPPEKARFYEDNGDPGTPGAPSDLSNVTFTIYQNGKESDDMSDILELDARDKLIGAALEIMDDPDYELMEVPF